MYVDASDLCNELAFTLGPTSTTELANTGLSAAASRSWNIKVGLIYENHKVASHTNIFLPANQYKY